MTRVAKAWNRRLTEIVEQGFTVADAARWASTLPLERSGRPAQITVDYRDAGFTAVEAVRWYDAVTVPDRAVRFANAGWDPVHAAMLRDRFRPSAWNSDKVLDQGVLADWIDTCIPPAWVLRYFDAGMEPEEALALEARRVAGEDLMPGLALLAALR